MLINENVLLIDYEAIKHNYNLLLSHHKSKFPLYAVIKANAYGHGLLPTMHALYSGGCRHFATYHLEPAITCKKIYSDCHMLVLGVTHPEHIQSTIDNNIEISISSISGLRHRISLSSAHQHLHIKVETGMNRLGILWSEREQLSDLLHEIRNENYVLSFYSHLSAGPYGKNKSRVLEQLHFFGKWVQWLQENKIPYKNLHLYNSVNFPFIEEQLQYGARIGISLYGYPDRNLLADFPFLTKLKKAFILKTWIMDVKEVDAQQYIGYDLYFKTSRASRIAYLPVGYSNGYPRLLGNRSRVLTAYGYAPVVGMINMNLLAIDITPFANIKIGDEIIMIGKNQHGEITAYELADLLETIPYEIITTLGNGNLGVYFKQE